MAGLMLARSRMVVVRARLRAGLANWCRRPCRRWRLSVSMIGSRRLSERRGGEGREGENGDEEA